MLTRSTIGKLLIEEALPEEMRGRNLTFDKKTVQSVLREVAQNHPDKYVEVSKKLADIGRQVATETGGFSFGLESLRQPESAKKTIGEIKKKVKSLLAAPNLTDKQRQEAIVRTVGGYQQGLMQDVYKETLAAKNPIAMQIMSGSRGNVMNLASLLGSDLLYEDHRGDIIPLPVLHSYSQGLSPAEYWAGTYGARKGVIATKFATADAGFFGKQLNQVAHRLAVVDQDDPRQDMGVRGFPVDTDDMDNEGALLAHDFGGYKRNTVLTPKILKDLKSRGFDRLLVRSPLTGGSPDGGVYARDVGVRERGVLPGRGEMVGMTAAQALAEPISQGQLSAKHSGGVAGQEKTVGGFQYIDQLIQVPKTFKGGAAHTTVDGKVQKIEDAPAGGKYIFINDKPQYVGQGFDIKVKPGDEVEAGDVLSEGIPNPSIVTQYKGIGEGRRYFTKAFRDALGSMGLRSHRRNIELIGRGLIDHVRLTEEYGDHVPDDVIPYSTLEHTYKPRDGALTTTPDRALNKYLEKPVLHYTIGTRVRPSMLKDFKYFGINDVTVHDKPAPFEPEMIRAMYNLHHDPDWMTRMYGSGLKGSLLEATHRGSTSSATGTSFVPGLSKGTDFGRVGVVQQPKMGLKPELNTPTHATPATPKPEKTASDDILPGGIGDKYNVSDFNPKEMKQGIKTEMEHTVNPAIAADVAKDHLVEDPKYYTKLKKVEKKSTYTVASGIAKTRNKKADDVSVKPETGSSTAKPTATTGAPPAPKAPATAPNAAITPPQTTPTGTPVNTPITGAAPKPYTMEHSFGNKKVTLNSNMTTQDIYKQLQENNFNSALGSAKQQELNRQKADALYRQMQLQNATGSPNATGTFQQGQLTSASATSPVQTPNPVTPQQTQPIQPQSANQIAPTNTLPQQPASAIPTPAPTIPTPSIPPTQNVAPQPPEPPANQNVPLEPQEVEKPENPYAAIGRAMRDIGMITGIGKTDPNINWSYDYMAAGDKLRKDSPFFDEIAGASIGAAEPKNKNVMTHLIQKQLINESDEMRNNPVFQESQKADPTLMQAGLDITRDFGVPTAVNMAKERILPTVTRGVIQTATNAAPAAATTLTASNVLRNIGTTVASPVLKPVTTAKNILNVATAPLRNPVTNLAIDSVLTAVQNKSYEDIMANADAYGDRFNAALKGLRSGTVMGTLGGLGHGALGTAGVAFSPADALQTATYALASPSRNSEEGQAMRRSSQAEAISKNIQMNADIEGYKPIKSFRTWEQYWNRPNVSKTINENTPEVQHQLALRKTFDVMSQDQLQKHVLGVIENNQDDPTYIQSYLSKLRPEQRLKFEQIQTQQQLDKLKTTNPAEYSKQHGKLKELEGFADTAKRVSSYGDADAFKFIKGLQEDNIDDEEQDYSVRLFESLPFELQQRLTQLYRQHKETGFVPKPPSSINEPVSRPWRMS